MTAREIYQKFFISPNLQEHMLRVAGIVLYIRSKWIGPEVDWDNLVKAALLHDLGNIVRFKFDQSSVAVYGDESKRLDYWKDKQQEMIKKYGVDDHEATQAMLREIAIDPKIVEWILSKSFANAEEIAGGNIWENKILLYCDMRVLPSGIGTLAERLDELEKRRPDLKEDPGFQRRIVACGQLENQIQKFVSEPLSSISDESASTDAGTLENTEV